MACKSFYALKTNKKYSSFHNFGSNQPILMQFLLSESLLSVRFSEKKITFVYKQNAHLRGNA